MQSQKPSSAMMKQALMRTTTGKEEPELTLLQRISSLELPASEIAAQINDSKSSRDTAQHTTVQKRLCESALHGRMASKKPLLKDTNKKKRHEKKRPPLFSVVHDQLLRLTDVEEEEPHCHVTDLLPVGCLIVAGDQAFHRLQQTR